MRFFYFCLVAILSSVLISCGGLSEANSGASNKNQASNTDLQKVEANNLPPGPSANRMQPPANGAPEIPINSNAAVEAVPKGTTQTPGVPDPKNAVQTPRPGATPTPGIPDPDTLKRQMEEIRKAGPSNMNQRPPGADDGMMMRKKPRAVNANNQ